MSFLKVTEGCRFSRWADDVTKGRALPIGTIRTHGGVKKQKTAQGWVPVKGDKKATAKKQGALRKLLDQRKKLRKEEYKLRQAAFKNNPGSHTLGHEDYLERHPKPEIKAWSSVHKKLYDVKRKIKEMRQDSLKRRVAKKLGIHVQNVTPQHIMEHHWGHTANEAFEPSENY